MKEIQIKDGDKSVMINFVDIEDILQGNLKHTKIVHREVPLAHKLKRTIEANIDKKFKTESINSFALRIAKKIVREREEKILEDMVYYHKPYELKSKDFGFVNVEPKFKTLKNRLKGKTVFYGPMLKYKERGLVETNGVRYSVEFDRKYKQIIKELTKKNVSFSKKIVEYDKEKIKHYISEKHRKRRLYYFNKFKR